MRIELVIWDDAWGVSESGSVTDKLTGYITHSVGWVVSEDESYLKIAMDTWPAAEGCFHTSTTVPKSLILKRIVLQQPAKKPRKKKC